jgi:hypothetical protein
MNDLLYNLSPNEFALLTVVVAIALSEGLTEDELNSLGNFISTVGDVMLTIAAQQQLLSGNNGNIEIR